MDVWITQARRVSKCLYCPEPIHQLEAEVVGRSKRTSNGRTFTRIRRWHPQCWVEQGLNYIQTHPVVIRQGRPKLALDDGQRARRRQLLVSHSQYMFYYRRAMLAGNILRAVRCYLKAYDMREEIADLGGVPRSWEASSGPAVSAVSPILKGESPGGNTGYE